MTMEFFAENVKEWYISLEDFVLDMTIDLAHDYLFMTPHFPVFFVLQAVLVCVSVRRCSLLGWKQSLFVSFAMAMTGRGLVAWISGRPSPLLTNALYTPCFCGIWYLMNCSPFDFAFRVVNNRAMFFMLQCVGALVQVRETCHGVDLGLRTFSSSVTGAIGMSCVLTCTECFVWMLFVSQRKCRYLSESVALRNAFMATVYWTLTQHAELVEEYVEVSREAVKMALLGVTCLLVIVDDAVYGLESDRCIDITLVSYLTRVLKFQGIE